MQTGIERDMAEEQQQPVEQSLERPAEEQAEATEPEQAAAKEAAAGPLDGVPELPAPGDEVDSPLGEIPGAASVEAQAPEAVPAKPKTRAKKKSAAAEPEPGEAASAESEAEDAGAEKRAAELETPRNPNFKWYILHAYSGFERKVRESIESRVQAFGLRERVGRVMIPTEPVTEIINGKKRTVERVFLPGYVLVEMDLDNNLWHVLKDTPKVTGFLGTGDKPVALSEEEVGSILFRSETAKEKPRLKIKFEKSEQVRITDGPFANFNGVVDEINEDRETLKVMVTIFGRSTPVELEFGKVEKIE
jgi:transcription termination/antitermination protein NusG